MKVNRPFAAAPAAEPRTEFRSPDDIPPEGIRRIPANAYEPDPWIELAWNLNQGWAWLTLYVTPGDLPIQQWHQKFSIPDMSYAEGVSVIRHLTHLANLLHSVYIANPDTAAFTRQVAEALQNFCEFLTR
jgi:hypothetical protein